MDSTPAPKTEGVHHEGEDEQPGGTIEQPTQHQGTAAPLRELKGSEPEPEVKAKTGRAKRREKRLRHEPQNVIGERTPTNKT